MMQQCVYVSERLEQGGRGEISEEPPLVLVCKPLGATKSDQ